MLTKWRKERHCGPAPLDGGDKEPKPFDIARSVTPETLREKAGGGAPLTIVELILVYRRHTLAYYCKNGEETREAGVIDDALRVLRKHYGLTIANRFGPVALDGVRDAMIDDLDWSRKYVNKQINRVRGLFTWAAAQDLIDPSVPAGLKKGRCRARETERAQ